MLDPEAPFGLKLDGTPRAKPGPRSPNTRAATQATVQRGINSAVNDPVKLAKAAAIVRTAIQRGKLTYADLAPIRPHTRIGSPDG